MPAVVSYYQNDFRGGVFSRKAINSFDQERYRFAARQMTNMIPTPLGNLVKRTGTARFPQALIDAILDDDEYIIRVMEFIHSFTDTRIMVATNKSIFIINPARPWEVEDLHTTEYNNTPLKRDGQGGQTIISKSAVHFERDTEVSTYYELAPADANDPNDPENIRPLNLTTNTKIKIWAAPSRVEANYVPFRGTNAQYQSILDAAAERIENPIDEDNLPDTPYELNENNPYPEQDVFIVPNSMQVHLVKSFIASGRANQNYNLIYSSDVVLVETPDEGTTISGETRRLPSSSYQMVGFNSTINNAATDTTRDTGINNLFGGSQDVVVNDTYKPVAISMRLTNPTNEVKACYVRVGELGDGEQTFLVRLNPFTDTQVILKKITGTTNINYTNGKDWGEDTFSRFSGVPDNRLERIYRVASLKESLNDPFILPLPGGRASLDFESAVTAAYNAAPSSPRDTLRADKIYNPFGTDIRDVTYTQQGDVVFFFHRNHITRRLTRTNEWIINPTNFDPPPLRILTDSVISIEEDANDIGVLRQGNDFFLIMRNSLFRKNIPRSGRGHYDNNNGSPLPTYSLSRGSNIDATPYKERWYRSIIGSGENDREFLDFVVQDEYFFFDEFGIENSLLCPIDYQPNEYFVAAKLTAISSSEQTDRITNNGVHWFTAGSSWAGYFYEDTVSPFNQRFQLRLDEVQSRVNYPGLGTTYRGRLALASSTFDLQTVFLSEVGNFLSFEHLNVQLESAENKAIIRELGGDNVTSINAIISQRDLLVLTDSGPSAVRGTRFDDNITPSNASASQVGTVRSSSIQPYRIENSSLFVDSDRERINDITYLGESLTEYVTKDLCLYADHIGKRKFVDFCVTHSPYKVIWACMEDGSLASCVRDNDAQVLAWSDHWLGGYDRMTSDLFVEHVAALPVSSIEADTTWHRRSYDSVFMVVRGKGDINTSRNKQIHFTLDYFDTDIGYELGDIPFTDGSEILYNEPNNEVALDDSTEISYQAVFESLPIINQTKDIGFTINKLTKISGVLLTVWDSRKVYIGLVGNSERTSISLDILESQIGDGVINLGFPLGSVNINNAVVIESFDNEPLNIVMIEYETTIESKQPRLPGGRS